MTFSFLEERSNDFAPFGFLNSFSSVVFLCLIWLYIKIDINVFNQATHYSLIFGIHENKSSQKNWITDSRKLVYMKYLEKADSQKLVLAKCGFFDLAKINALKVGKNNSTVLFIQVIESIHVFIWWYQYWNRLSIYKKLKDSPYFFSNKLYPLPKTAINIFSEFSWFTFPHFLSFNLINLIFLLAYFVFSGNSDCHTVGCTFQIGTLLDVFLVVFYFCEHIIIEKNNIPGVPKKTLHKLKPV